MEVLSVLWNIFLVGLLIYVLAVAGFLVAVFTENRRNDEFEDQRRQAELDQGRERAAAREVERKMRWYGNWARDRADERTRDRGRP
jgi:hypothetical protein